MAQAYILPVEVRPLEDGTGYLATCDSIQGCHAEGGSVAEAVDNLEDVARALVELRLEDGLGIPDGLQQVAEGGPRLKAEIVVSVG